MKKALKCRLCGLGIVVEVDDGYEFDAHKLFPLATCNRCYDLRERRIKLETSIRNVCYNLTLLAGNSREVQARRETGREVLTTLTRKYSAWAGDACKVSGHIWSQDFADMLCEHPDKWGQILNAYVRHLRHAKPQPNQSRPVMADQ